MNALKKKMAKMKVGSKEHVAAMKRMKNLAKALKKKEARIQAKYDRSLEVLKRLGDAGLRTKSGVMLGLGETVEEVVETMEDLRSVNCQVVTLGQYLQPTPKHLPVAEFIHPDVFADLEQKGKEMGFRHVESGPLVRSSYHAEKHVL